MPNHRSCLAYFFATTASGARVLVECGLLVLGSRTSHMTSLFAPPRMGSGQMNTGFRTQSEVTPSAWLVLDPSKPQTGGSCPSSRTRVLERSLCVGSAPSIQMYSALYAISLTPPFSACALASLAPGT